ncbi:MAG: hypothetical protein J4O01_02620 [Chloroflexi bacterium]|nr:hypothetical protein [Chloroflexota bacterium]MCI0835932.1 hypothetical protein [Chloroflexota bacterium]MCI0850932.1 hypothetical protein [Chloroflexota bacterium]MCI0873338.1 hypothetical protein [Chloroflexota bacterium]
MRTGGMVFGLAVVLVGAAILFGNLDVSGSGAVGDYWPVLLIVIGFFGWVGRSLLPGLGSMLMMSLGGILLAQNLIADTSFGDLWPVLVIAIGVSIIFGPRHRRHHGRGYRMKFRGGGRRWRNRHWVDSSHDSDALFSGGGRQVDGEYTGSRARVKLASDGIDLTAATLPEAGATLELDVLLGEYKIRVPNDWKLDIRAEVTMGQIDVNRPTVEEERSGPTLTIDGRVLMGGVEISG